MAHHDRVSTKSKSKLIAIEMDDDEEKEPISRSRARSSRKRRYKKRLSEHKEHRAQSDAMTSDDGEAIDLEADEFVVSSEDTDSNDVKEEPNPLMNHRKITDFGNARSGPDSPDVIPDNLMNRNWRRNGKVSKGGDNVSSDAMSNATECKSEGLARTGAVYGNRINPKDEELSTTNDFYDNPMP